MDLNKTGKFITERRKAKGFTQNEIATKLCVTDRAVSKWECGKGIPDVSIMMSLCEILDITVNELLSGEKIEEQERVVQAEKQIMNLLCERQENKKKIWLSVIVAAVGMTVLMAAVLLSSYAITDFVTKILVIVFGVVICIACLAVTIIIDVDTGAYECQKCHKTFTPDIRTYMKSTQAFSRRKMTCPHCGERSWCKKRLNK